MGFWGVLAIGMILFSAGLIVGVLIDRDRVYNTTIKRIKHKRGSGDIVLDVKTNPDPETKQTRREKRKAKKRAKRNGEQKP